jgi:hypothetical protein
MNEIEKALHKLKLPGMATCWTSLCETHRIDKLCDSETWVTSNKSRMLSGSRILARDS